VTITPMIPSASRLGGDLDRAGEILARARTVLGDAGEGARAFTRCAVTVQSAEAVDAVAGLLGVTARWTERRTHYYARFTAGGREAEIEVIYYPRDDETEAVA
jgi:hypothetical protein